MNKFIVKAVKEDSFFCNNYLNIQLDFLMKLYHKTEHPIVGDYMVRMLKKIKHYRFWKIIRPIIVDQKLDFWRIKFNHISKEYIDEKIFYLPSYYTRDDISYTFRFLRMKNIKDYIDFHLDKIEKIITTEFNILYEKYKYNIIRKYNNNREKILERMRSEDIILLTTPILNGIKISKVSVRNMQKKAVKKYLSYVDF